MLAGWKSQVLVLAIVAASLGASAQNAGQPTPPPSVGSPVTGARPKRTLEGVTEMRRLVQLKLSDDQITKLKPIVDDEGIELSAVRLDEHLTPDLRRERIQAIRNAYRPKINAILTPEQQAKWKQMDEPAPAKSDEKPKPAESPPKK